MGNHLTSDTILQVSSDGAIGLTHAFLVYFYESMPPPFKLEQPNFTTTHEALIKTNWTAISHGTSAFDPRRHLTPSKFFYTTFYRTLFRADPSLRAMFRSSMTVQGKSLAGILNTLIMVVHGNHFITTIQTIAEQHLVVGVTKHHYAVFGQALLDALELVSGDAWSAGMRDAYLNAYSLVFYIMLPIILTAAPDPIAASLLATIAASTAISPTAKRISLVFDFSLRFHPGDAIWLGLPLPTGYVRRHFCITSISMEGTNAIDICVESLGEASQWLCDQPVGATVDLFWVESDVRLEIDTPHTLPPHIVFASDGIGCIPCLVMLEGLYLVRDVYRGSVVSIQSAPSPNDIALFKTGVSSTGHGQAICDWDASTIVYAPTISVETLGQHVPKIEDAEFYVCGPAAFVAATQSAWVTAGGAEDRMHEYSFDNTRAFPMSAIELSSAAAPSAQGHVTPPSHGRANVVVPLNP
ncbi:Aste57867_23401 [Aphanomyces stellatus]|uniref:nitric oxide dioxygenase n=1 Tax=Aphanomyces stellatus TaxID=120398 RepID=A0A485LMN5_9STRA|nr:hypothetical protein As57867_023330 [Aphanomyces stellatus]VFU00047.1 Aste57867_23401 [Aphanomyces stellatus]